MAMNQNWRLMIAELPEDEKMLEMVAFNHPKYNCKTWYLISNTSNKLYELQTFEDNSDCSLFIDNYCSQENTIYLVSEMDPLFVLIGLLLKNRMKSHSDSNKYCMQPITQQIDSIEYFNKLFCQNTNKNEILLSNICNVKNIDENEPLYVVLDDDKVINWLSIKFEHICKYLKLNETKLNTNDMDSSNNYKNEALSLLNEYVPNYFFVKLCEKYNVNPTRVENAASKKRKTMEKENNDNNHMENDSKSKSNEMDDLLDDPLNMDEPAAKRPKLMANNNSNNGNNSNDNNSTNKYNGNVNGNHDFSLAKLGTPLTNKNDKKANNRPRSTKNKQLAKVSTKGMKSMSSYFSAKKK